MQRPLGAQISHMLKARGVEVIFGIPGVHNQEMYRGIDEAGITHVLARHEQGAGFMADGYARASGKPGVAYVITGPGVCNIMTAMGQAYSDSVPMLVISSCLDEGAARRGQLHQMKDQRAAAETVCAWSEEARSPEATYALIDRALGEMRLGRPRPRHIQVPIALLEGAAPPAGPAPASCAPERGRLPADLFAPILAARRPLFVLGGGCVSAVPQARAVLAGLGAASFETYAGRGIAGDHPLNFGSYLARPESAETIGSADVVVLLGTELAEPDIWRPEAGLGGHTIQVDIDTAAFVPEAAVTVVARVEHFLDDLSRALADHAPSTGWDPEEVRAARQRWRAQVDAEMPGVLPVAEALRDCLPEDVAIYSDMTQFAYASKEFWPLRRPGSWHHPTGFGTLGYALPAAIGGCLARGGAPTLAIAGDYGFQFTSQELGTAVELGLGLPILLWDNARLMAIEHSMVRAQIAPKAVEARNPDFARLAEAYGARACTPATLAAMQEEVVAAFTADLPTLIRVTPGLPPG